MEGRLEKEQKIYRILDERVKNLPDFLTGWYLNLRASDCSAKTCRDYINKVNRYFLSITENPSNITIDDFTRDSVVSYLISVKTKQNDDGSVVETSDSYQQTVWYSLNNFFSYLEEEGYIEENYVKKIKKGKNRDLVKINEHRVLVDEIDFQKIICSVESGCGSEKAKAFQKHTRNRDMSIFLIFMTTGIRESAIASINLEDIDVNKKTLIVLDKGNIYHKFELTDKTFDYICKWIEDRKSFANDTSALFVSRYGNRISENGVSKLVKKFCYDALGYELSPHKLRAGFITIMYQKTGDIELVRRMVGHSNGSTTQRYIVTNGHERVEMRNIMAGIIG